MSDKRITFKDEEIRAFEEACLAASTEFEDVDEESFDEDGFAVHMEPYEDSRIGAFLLWRKLTTGSVFDKG